jgi:hypothetical protein
LLSDANLNQLMDLIQNLSDSPDSIASHPLNLPGAAMPSQPSSLVPDAFLATLTELKDLLRHLVNRDPS